MTPQMILSLISINWLGLKNLYNCFGTVRRLYTYVRTIHNILVGFDGTLHVLL